MQGYCMDCQKIKNIINLMIKKLNTGKIVVEGNCETCLCIIRKKKGK